jgi:2-iminobutanoate/2-iminopropanoate deaminase
VREPISTATAPRAVGPYSQGIRTESLFFVSGQGPVEPSTGLLVEGDIEIETHRVMKNIEQVLLAAGLTLDSVVRTTIFLTNLDEFATVNRVYGSYFKGAPPTRSTVQVSRLPMEAHVEIDAIAVVRS